MRLSPDYLAYTVPCPLNAGKLAQVEAFVNRWRELAGREAAWQWQRFFQGAVRVDCGHGGHVIANLSNDAGPAPTWAFRSSARNHPR